MFVLSSHRGEISETANVGGALLAAATHVAEDEGTVHIELDGRPVGRAFRSSIVGYAPFRTSNFVTIILDQEAVQC